MDERDAGRGDVQELSDFELAVYETVAEIDREGQAADFEAIRGLMDVPEEDLWAALGHLVSINHVHSTTKGYVLGPHDWEA